MGFEFGVTNFVLMVLSGCDVLAEMLWAFNVSVSGCGRVTGVDVTGVL